MDGPTSPSPRDPRTPFPGGPRTPFPGGPRTPFPGGPRRPFLGVHFQRCGVYGRLYPNRDGTAYIGRCPKCAAPLRVTIGSHGTAGRFFTALCP